MINLLQFKRNGVWLFVVALLLLIVSTYHRSPHIDDAWLGEYAYWYSENGVVSSQIFKSVDSYKGEIFTYHKLHLLLGSTAINLFGFKLSVLKFTSLLSLLLLCFVFYLILKNKLNRQLWWLMGLLLASSLLLQFSFIYRPEVWVTAFGLLAFYFFSKYNASNNNWHLIILCGISCGLAFLFHLNGIIYPIAFGIVLLYHNKFKGFGLLLLSTLIVGIWYFSHIHSIQEFQIWKSQLMQDHIYNTNNNGLVNFISNLIHEHERYFRNPKEVVITVLFFFSLFIIKKEKTSFHKTTILITLIIMLVLALLNQAKTAKYMILILPFCLMVIGFAWKKITDNKLLWNKGVFYILLLGYLVTNVISSVGYIKTHQNNVVANNEAISKTLRGNTNILAPTDFIFNEIKKFESIEGYRAMQMRFGNKPTLKQMLKYAEEGNLDYVILKKSNINIEEIEQMAFSFYTNKKVIGDYYIFSSSLIN